MEQYAIGFWGCFFGATGLMLAGSVFAYTRSLHQVAVNAAISAITSSFFVVAFLGGLPIEGADTLARFLAHVACWASVLLTYLLFSLLGFQREATVRHRNIVGLTGLASTVMVTGWFSAPQQSLVLGTAQAIFLGLVALALTLRSAWRGDRLAWAAVAGVCFMLVAIAGLGWIALDRAHAPWQVHAVSALAGTAYLSTLAAVLWTRYSYLIELREVMAHGPSYDPITRMRSHSETGHMVGEVFKRYHDEPVPLGVIVISIANLYVLEKLYGLAAVNHALFVCAGRLRRSVPGQAEMGRLGNDGFLLLVRNARDSGRLIHLARTVQARMSKSVVLNTSLESRAMGHQETRWSAEVGVGVLRVSRPDAHGPAAVAMGRDMSRTAWSYPSRVAWYDETSGDIVDMPVLAS